MSEQKVVHTQWLKRGLNTFIPTDNSVTVPKVEPGVYDIRHADNIGWYLFKKTLFLDELLEFPSSTHHKVVEEVKNFYQRKNKFKEYGYAFKRGILLHGAPGMGKSCLLNLCIKYIIERLDGVVFSLKTGRELDNFAAFVPEIFKIIEPQTPIIVCFEDVENLCRDNESQLLNILDGLEQLESITYLGTTNYIENLKERIVNRPSRFDRRIYIGTLQAEDRRFYFEKKLKPLDLKAINLDRWVKDTEGYSVAHLAELIKSVVIFGNDYQESIDLLNEMRNFKILHSTRYEKEERPIGFIGSNNTESGKRTVTENSTPSQPKQNY